jgi:coenzyme F420-reducing hydrogenase alpha subunit
MNAKTITISPITRPEGHGKIEIFLKKEGIVENAYFQINLYDHSRKLLKTVGR